ncbi:DNA repair protein RadA [Defluviitalea raffinosedens]|uniref:DNA repair protein RadA n=1 Tax=Defluviitalea raffinosedens TaxID=1450156 RepID=A0A7C8HG50_9FIRM|nr:DNA repair protein RadA [Defluviitalea raffinosedens]KAE9635377.1 DNA repair protein RadA [Defluviitalea raffinosedens]
MAKAKNIYVCQECGYESPKWMGKCPGCNGWSTFVEEIAVPKRQTAVSASDKKYAPLSLENIGTDEEQRIRTGSNELDRVLGGGIVKGSLVLVGGDPGIGKSTLLLQMCEHIGNNGAKILYASGEESVRQIKMRADRLGVKTSNLLLISETNMDVIEGAIKNASPDLVIVDSIQTVFKEEITSAPGSVSQVREATSSMMRISKGQNIPIIIVGHVTKEGSLAGPRVLEHMVDTVLYFEGERHATYRVLRAVKNRFGSTNEIGVFEMQDKGLMEVQNPSELMLAGRPLNVPGSIVTCCMEGTRPMLVEVQALVCFTNFGMPRRTATGIDYNRVVLLMAVLEKRVGMQLISYDSYVNLAGGIKVTEPALDLGIIAAIASSFKDQVIDPHMAVFGEVGLTGEVRGISMAEKRIMECAKMGFKACVIPKANLKGLKPVDGIKIYGVENVNEALQIILK